MNDGRKRMPCDARRGFSKVFSCWIEKRNETHAAIAAEIGVAPSTLTAWINGDRAPGVDNLQAICDYTGIPMQRLLCERSNCDECMKESDCDSL